MDARQAFKHGFIARCIEFGFTTPDQIHDAVKTAAEKVGNGLGVGSLIGLEAGSEGLKGIANAGKSLLGWGGALALGVPPALGYLGGNLAAQATDISDDDVDEAKRREVIDEYHRQSARLLREGQLRRFTQQSSSSPRGGRSLL